MRFNKRLGGVIGAFVMVLAGGVFAYAVFTATGSGSGTAKAVTAQSATITGQTCGTADLYPGGPAGAICFTINNPNPYTVHFTAITYLPSGGSISSNNATSCPASNVAIASSAPTTVNYTVAANSTTSLISLAGVASMVSMAPDGCQGVSFNVPIALSGTQQ